MAVETKTVNVYRDYILYGSKGRRENKKCFSVSYLFLVAGCWSVSCDENRKFDWQGNIKILF